MFSASENKQEQQTFCGDVFFPLTENENKTDGWVPKKITTINIKV